MSTIYNKQFRQKPDSFSNIRVGNIIASSTISSGKKSAKLASLQIQFGFNIKADAPKKQQLKLF